MWYILYCYVQTFPFDDQSETAIRIHVFYQNYKSNVLVTVSNLIIVCAFVCLNALLYRISCAIVYNVTLFRVISPSRRKIICKFCREVILIKHRRLIIKYAI